jgi:hypothetical protein
MSAPATVYHLTLPTELELQEVERFLIKSEISADKREAELVAGKAWAQSDMRAINERRRVIANVRTLIEVVRRLSC